MDDSRTTRRLAAILVADVVGYVRLMQANEATTLQALKERRTTILEPVIRDHGGRIVKVMGDGVLVEFFSAVNAVNAALNVQQRYGEANKTAPEDRQIVLRIGVNLGEVVGEGDDIFGDGVNIAARLEPLADPGGICISAKMHDEIRGKVAAAFDDVGEQQLKNLANPVRAYRWQPDERPIAPAAPVSDKPSIAVLPFLNMSGDLEQQYFSDGITEDIITELARFRNLHVVARNLSFRYRGAGLDLVRVGRDLGVAYAVEGSIRKLGTRIRITAQLIDTKTGHHVWAEKFDRDQSDIFAVQDQVVRTIVGTLTGRLSAVSADVAMRKFPANLAAYECVLRADALPFIDPKAQIEARRLYEKAIALDPQYARAYALLAINYNIEWERDLDAPDSILDKALELASKAVTLDDNDSVCHNALGLVYLNRRSHSLAEHHYRRALELNPNRPALMASMGYLYTSLGEPEKAISLFMEARALDPYFQATWYWTSLAAAYFDARRYSEAIDALGRASDAWYWKQALLAACHAQLGHDNDAQHYARETLRLSPGFSIAKNMKREALKRHGDRQHLIEALRKAGLPE
jgi:TolB-like protein/Tfp pilus assembly protein PilF